MRERKRLWSEILVTLTSSTSETSMGVGRRVL